MHTGQSQERRRECQLVEGWDAGSRLAGGMLPQLGEVVRRWPSRTKEV